MQSTHTTYFTEEIFRNGLLNMAKARAVVLNGNAQ